MQLIRKNCTQSQQEINIPFQLVLQHLFSSTYNGIKSNNKLVTRILLLAAIASYRHHCV